ncbi:hypothetical protein [Synechococcus phage BUCT-ZZ01]|nr:hypothetical protein [Synechococcus phage BUCT-ZZ01]
MQNFTLYLDMDGVFADFDTYWEYVLKNKYGVEREDFDRELFRKEVKENDFFLHLPLCSNAMKLLDFVKSLDEEKITIEMLSASGMSNREHVDRCRAQKTLWARKIGIDFKVNVVGNKEEKQKFVRNRGTIIIDDNADTINAWNLNGGIGIYYQNDDADRIIERLRIFMNSIEGFKK